MSNQKGIHKPASRITLEDLFGSGPTPTLDEIRAVASREKAQKSEARSRKPGERRDPSKPQVDHKRLDAIQAAAESVGRQPAWAKAWHPTARVYVEARTECRNCGTIYTSPGAAGWLVEYTNSRTGATHTTDVAGPIDTRLPRKKFTHEGHTNVCGRCCMGLVVWPPQSVTILKLEILK